MCRDLWFWGSGVVNQEFRGDVKGLGLGFRSLRGSGGHVKAV